MRCASVVAFSAWLISAVASAEAAPPAQAGDALKGRRVFLAQCAACHTVTAKPTPTGPGLAGIMGQAAGSRAGYPFSEALKSSGVVWDQATLDRYLADPLQMIPGGTMTLKVTSAPARADVIAFLGTLREEPAK